MEPKIALPYLRQPLVLLLNKTNQVNASKIHFNIIFHYAGHLRSLFPSGLLIKIMYVLHFSHLRHVCPLAVGVSIHLHIHISYTESFPLSFYLMVFLEPVSRVPVRSPREQQYKYYEKLIN
jgi:hypothetical protein